STGAPQVKDENVLTPGQVDNRFLELYLYRNRPLHPRLSGLALEYAVVQIYSKDAGKREAKISFHAGQGSQDIGFRNAIDILFESRPSVTVIFHVNDDDGAPTMASFVIMDGIERIRDDREDAPSANDYRLMMARSEFRPATKQRRGIYPLPSRRVAARDAYPDFFFHPQVYRADGEHVSLPPGTYDVTFTRGPEYISQTKPLVVPPDADTVEASFQLKRWIHMADLGWYSADHHVHAAGCSHYESPEEGVRPEHMWRQVVGEDLNIASALAWGPCWYYQKSFFTGQVHPLSTEQNILRYDVEVSGFPSSHAGHLVLLRLQEDDYPGTTRIEEWPSWTLPVLQWAKAQGGVVGYAHSGWGLEPVEPTDALPNDVTPQCDGIGANEYVVTVTHDAVDFYSAGDTPAPWELNMWYHALNNGFRTRLSGETDFPCIFDERVGLARSYARLEGTLDYDRYIEAIRQGRSYVSDGSSHLIDFSIDGLELGTNDSELSLEGPQTVTITARVAAYLPEEQDETGALIASRALHQQPYWHLERARLGTTRSVPVELIVNGEPVETRDLVADGAWNDLTFAYAVERSSWVALRIYPSAHTNPIFVIVDDQPIRLKQSAAWARRAVDQCWTMKAPRIRDDERAAAEAAYDKARAVYDQIIRDASEN
ncbi:MAG: CehA/McbA family metallohydrolase, partial [Bacteroidetes bacterium]|nr:CehA/McbA family metallohydrolase [Bacteroidota bacterium]